MAQSVRSYRAERERRARRMARFVGACGFIAAVALPIVLWHRAIAALAGDFHVEPRYLVTGWLGYGLIFLGLLFLVPVMFSIGRKPDSRLYPHSRNALAGWGVSLYLLGTALAVQVAAIADGLGGH